MIDEQPARDLSVERIVLKDLSFETPMGQDVFTREWQPEYKVRLDLRRDGLAEKLWEVVLTVTVTASLESEIVFVLEVQQAGVFTVADLEPESLRRALAIEAPRLIFPYLREAVDSVVAKGGFPSVGLQLPDFEAWHQDANRPEMSSADEP